MKTQNLLIAVVVLAAFITVYGAGAFSVNTPQDPYYDYSIAPINYAAGGEIPITVVMKEKAEKVISSATVTTCNQAPAACGACGTCSVFQCSDGVQRCSMPTPPRSRSNFNARSIRVFIDGNELYNLYNYPSKMGSSPDSLQAYSFSTRFADNGLAYCWGFGGGGSCGQGDQANLPPAQRAYVYSSGILGPGVTYNGDVFTLSALPLPLASGNHTVDVYMYAETSFEDGKSKLSDGYYASLTYNSLINGWQSGEKNLKYNYHLTGIISVPVSENEQLLLNNISILQGTLAQQLAQIAALQATTAEKAALLDQLNLTITQQTTAIAQLTSQRDQQAIYISQLTDNSNEQAQMIAQLTSNINEQGAIIASLNATVQEKALLIAQLTDNINEQAQMINNLQVNLATKAALIDQLTVTTAEQAALIAQMRLSFADQGVIISALNATINNDASIITTLTSKITEQGQIISGMALTNQQQAQLIVSLTNNNQQQAQLISQITAARDAQGVIIQNMQLNIEQQAEVVRQLTLSNTEQGRIIASLNLTLNEQKTIIESLTTTIDQQAAIIAQMRLTDAEQAALINQLTGGNAELSAQLASKVAELRQNEQQGNLIILAIGAVAVLLVFRKFKR